MEAIDRMELSRYLDILQAAARRRERREKEKPPGDASGRGVVELHRGTIDDVW